MKHIANLTLSFLILINAAIAQIPECPALKLKNGMKLIYSTETAPPALYKMKGEYYMAKPKEQQKMKAAWEKEPWNKDVQTNTVLITTLMDKAYIATTVKRAKENSISIFLSSCNDKEYIAKGGFQQVDANGKVKDFTNSKINYVTNDSNKVTGFSILYDKSIPFDLSVGMKLPDAPLFYNVFTMGTQITFPREKILSTTVNNRWVGNSSNLVAFNFGSVTKSVLTEQITANIATTAISEGFAKNREVTAEKEVTVSGTTYKAYLIREELWTGGTQWVVESDDEWVKKKNQHQAEKSQKAVMEVLKKNENANEKGYIVTTTESWFIPGIGVYAMTSFDSWGSKVGYLELKEIQ